MRSLGSNDTIEVNDDLKKALTSDHKTASLSEFDILMLSYAAKVTTEAHTVDRAYVDFLKAKGFDDRTLHDIVQVTAYFNYVNRLADGLGVELESDESKR